MNVQCPRCGKATSLKQNPFRPFCSERCKAIDLGNWISERYNITSPLPENEDSSDDQASPDDDSEDGR